MSSFKSVNNFWFWCQKVLPLVYDDSISYYEVLCKLSEYLNQVINNVNALPDIIDEAIKEYIESGDIQNALDEMLQNFNPINVKNPPAGLSAAKGDGADDDTAALQAMIEYGSEHGLPMIFPAGIYRVSNLTIPETANFLGMTGATIFKTENSSNALISVSGNFSAFNMIFNGNIAGNVNPQNIITGTCENINVNECNFTGCVSCIDVNISDMLEVTNCHFENYTDYGVHAGGTGRAIINGMEVDNVANSGAMRFVRLDASNSIIDNLTSLASVPVGVEISGDFNTIIASIPNCENPVSDGGQNNNIDIIGSSKKISLSKSIDISANEIKIETSNISATANTSTETISQTKSVTGENILLQSSSTTTVKGNDVSLMPLNPLTYKEPTTLNEYFDYVKFKTNANKVYKVLVAGTNIDELNSNNVINVKQYGAKGDGATDDIDAINNAKNAAIEKKLPLYFPEGEYLISTSLIGWDNMTLIGANKYTSIIRIKENVYEPCVNFNNTTEKTQFQNIVVKNLCFDGNKQDIVQPTLNSHAFRLVGFTNLIIDYCRFINAGGYGLGLEGRPDNPNHAYTGRQQYCFINGCDFTNNGLSAETAGNSDGCDIKLVRYLFMSNCVSWNNSDGGIDIRAERAVLNNIICRLNGSVGLHVRTPSYCELTNIFTESNTMSGVTCFAGAGYSGYGNQFLCKINGIFSSADNVALVIAYEGEETYPIYIDAGNVYCTNAQTGIDLSSITPKHYVTIHGCSLIGNNKTGSTGIKNGCSNAQFTDIYLNRFVTGYAGENTSTGSKLNLQNNNAQTPVSGTSPEINYSIFPKIIETGTVKYDNGLKYWNGSAWTDIPSA